MTGLDPETPLNERAPVDHMAEKLFRDMLDALPAQFSRDPLTVQSQLLEAIAIGVFKTLKPYRRVVTMLAAVCILNSVGVTILALTLMLRK